jgi:hypothetical protein
VISIFDEAMKAWGLLLASSSGTWMKGGKKDFKIITLGPVL